MELSVQPANLGDNNIVTGNAARNNPVAGALKCEAQHIESNTDVADRCRCKCRYDFRHTLHLYSDNWPVEVSLQIHPPQ